MTFTNTELDRLEAQMVKNLRELVKGEIQDAGHMDIARPAVMKRLLRRAFLKVLLEDLAE